MRTSGWSSRVVISLWALAGCGGPNDGGAGSAANGSSSSGLDPWWDTTGDGSGPATVSASATTGTTAPGTTTTQGTSGGEETEGEAEGEPDEIGIFGWSIIEPGVSFMGMEAEFIAFVGGEEVCVITWELESGVPNDTCEACDFAFDIARTEPVVADDIACDDYIDPDMIPAMVSLGFAPDEELWMYDGSRWVEAGFAEFLPERDNVFGWFIPYQEQR
ncbi:MAG: hypothetical protein K0V04_01135 [Deltaproteobacteria bacterium]|nr:hypothetical protein [Deltaproteobacteria bacterium]